VSLPDPHVADPATRTRGQLKLLCFASGGQTFGLPIDAVKETIEARPLTRLFLVPPFVAGLINLRGDVVAVLDLLALLGLPTQRRQQTRNIVILRASLLSARARHDRAAANRAAAGLLVDALDGVRDVPASDVKPVPSTIAAEPAEYLDGVAAVGTPPRPLIVIAPERVLGAERLRSFRRSITKEAR
jgi:purine-binding chemotaxis protein CheW